jgi:hypothetical protein
VTRLWPGQQENKGSIPDSGRIFPLESSARRIQWAGACSPPHTHRLMPKLKMRGFVDYLASNFRMMHQLEMVSKVVAQSGNCPGICHKELEKTTKNLGQDRRWIRTLPNASQELYTRSNVLSECAERYLHTPHMSLLAWRLVKHWHNFIFTSYYIVCSSVFRMAGRMVNNYLDICGRQWSWPSLRYFHSIYL